MKSPRWWLSWAMVVAGVVALEACHGKGGRVASARVVVDVNAVEPLLLIVSTDFEMIVDPNDGSRSPSLTSRDSLWVTSGYDETYALDAVDPRIFTQLSNPTETPESVRMRVFLDGEAAYDVSTRIASPGYLQYVYQFNTPTTGGE